MPLVKKVVVGQKADQLSDKPVIRSLYVKVELCWEAHLRVESETPAYSGLSYLHSQLLDSGRMSKTARYASRPAKQTLVVGY